MALVNFMIDANCAKSITPSFPQEFIIALVSSPNYSPINANLFSSKAIFP